jgi:hypothetical protein
MQHDSPNRHCAPLPILALALRPLLSPSFPPQFPLETPQVPNNVVKCLALEGFGPWSFGMDRSVPGEHEQMDSDGGYKSLEVEKFFYALWKEAGNRAGHLDTASQGPLSLSILISVAYFDIVFLAPGSSRHTVYAYYIARRQQTIDPIFWTVLASISY